MIAQELASLAGVIILIFPFFLFPPFISSFTIFLGSDCHSCINISCTAGASSTWHQCLLDNFFILLVVVNNPLTQRKDSYSLSPIDGTFVQFQISNDIFWRIGSSFVQKVLRKKLLASFFLDAAFELGSPIKNNFIKQTLSIPLS